MTCGIYQIYCTKTEKSYIGQSINIEGRWNQHKYDLRNNSHINCKLQDDWNKYNESSFEFIILKEDGEEFLNVLEMHYIQKYNSIENGYNIRNEKGIIKNKFKYDNELKNVNIIEVLENSIIDLNIKELLVVNTLDLASYLENEYGTWAFSEMNPELKPISDEHLDILKHPFYITSFYSKSILDELVKKHINETIGKYVDVCEVFISSHLESEVIDIEIDMIETLLNVIQNKNLPLNIVYKEKDDESEKELLVNIPINDIEPVINKKQWENHKIKRKIKELEMQLVE